MGEPVTGADDEGVEGVLDLEGTWRADVPYELRAVRAHTVRSLRALAAIDADNEGHVLFTGYRGQGFFKERFEPALDVLFRKEIGDGNLQMVIAEVHWTGAFEPNSVRGRIDMLGYPIQYLYPDLFC